MSAETRLRRLVTVALNVWVERAFLAAKHRLRGNTSQHRARPARFGDTSARADGFAVRCGEHVFARYATRPEADAAAETAAAAYAAWLRDEAVAGGLLAETVTRDGLTVTSPAGDEVFAVEPC